MSTSWSNNWLLSLKIVLISTGVVSMAVALKLSVPVAADLVASQLPSLWSSLLSWLTPPYLYILINCIIISIVASSKLHNPKSEDTHDSETIPPPAEMVAVPPVTTVKIPAAEVRPEYTAYNGVALSEYGYDSNVLPEVSDSYGDAAAVETVEDLNAEPEKEESEVLNVGDDTAAAAASRPARSGLQRKDSMEFWLNENQRPPVSARFAHRKASPEGGRSLGVSKPKRHDTLESTWKTITDGRSVPLTRHLKKSDTWERRMDQNTPPANNNTMNKSETFHERSRTTATGSPVRQSPGSSGARLRKEPSLSQDELNRRVEAFINKFNEEMRLQRQESLNQYQEMVGRGAQAAPLAH
ncbi:uncharacterized protein LOC133731948 [Rosa rugosa]|uniref:uncharacterized protein LOC133731948 n=1 Tax=Rosa rugosa TaxID=74645 RepID=UPI002B4120C6|nr:uncharacterized protein LOC133731948 [Rosa rugosa]